MRGKFPGQTNEEKNVSNYQHYKDSTRERCDNLRNLFKTCFVGNTLKTTSQR